jgi:hypothetical protein
MATAPSYAATPRRKTVQISTANTNRDGTGTLGTSLAGGSNGTVVKKIDIVAPGTTTAGMVRAFIDDGTNVRLYREYPIPAVTPSATVPCVQIEIQPLDLVLLSTDTLKFSTHNAETFNVHVTGGDL